MDALTALLTRASAPRLTDPGPTEEQLQSILSAAENAPDHGRMRPWSFLVIRGAGRDRLGDVLAASLSRRNAGATETVLEAERKKAQRAPVIIVVSVSVSPNPKVPDIEQVVAAGASAQNILLAAHALGFGAFWRTGPAAYDDFVKEQLGIPAGDTIVAFVYIGSLANPLPQRNLSISPKARFL
jgi:nitroreductase